MPYISYIESSLLRETNTIILIVLSIAIALAIVFSLYNVLREFYVGNREFVEEDPLLSIAEKSIDMLLALKEIVPDNNPVVVSAEEAINKSLSIIEIIRKSYPFQKRVSVFEYILTDYLPSIISSYSDSTKSIEDKNLVNKELDDLNQYLSKISSFIFQGDIDSFNNLSSKIMEDIS